MWHLSEENKSQLSKQLKTKQLLLEGTRISWKNTYLGIQN